MSEIEWTDVDSSNIAAVGYDNETKELHVTFHSGAEYVYEGVEPEVVHFFLMSPSKGRYLNENIKGKYNYHKIG